MKRISKTSSAVFASMVILLMLAFYFFNEKDVVISNIEWNCGEYSCDVTFDIENMTSNYLSLNVSMRAFRTKDLGEGAVVSELVGEKVISLKISPQEVSDIKESLKIVRGRVAMIAVTTWNIKKSVNMP